MIATEDEDYMIEVDDLTDTYHAIEFDDQLETDYEELEDNKHENIPGNVSHGYTKYI